MAEQRKSQNPDARNDNPRQKAAGQQSDPDSVVRKGGIARSDADIADVSRDTHGFPSGEGDSGRTTEPPDMRRGAAAEADAALTESLEEARADEEPAQKTGKRGQGPDESEAVGE